MLKELREAEKKALKDWAKDKGSGQLRVLATEDSEEPNQLSFKRVCHSYSFLLSFLTYCSTQGDVITVTSLPSGDGSDSLPCGVVLGIHTPPAHFPPRSVSLLSEEDPAPDFQLLHNLLIRSDFLVINAVSLLFYFQ